MSNDEYTVEFADRVKQAAEEYLQSQELKYHWDEEAEHFELAIGFPGCSLVGVIVRIDAEDNDPTACKLSILCSALHVPEEMRGEVAQFLLGVNYYNIIQGFTMDLNDGQITFESMLFCYHRIIPPQNLIERYFDVTIFEMRRALPLLVLLIQGDLTAKDALQKFLNGVAHE